MKDITYRSTSSGTHYLHRLLHYTLLILATTVTLACIILAVMLIAGSTWISLHQSVGSSTTLTIMSFLTLMVMLIIAGIHIIAISQLLVKSRSMYNWSLTAGSVSTVLIILQLLIFPLYPVFHLASLTMGILIILVSLQLNGNWLT